MPGLATGSTILLKPSPDTSLVALRLGELFCEAGPPDGVLNIVTSLVETVGAAQANHDDVARALASLASEYDGFITGATLDINAGVYTA